MLTVSRCCSRVARKPKSSDAGVLCLSLSTVSLRRYTFGAAHSKLCQNTECCTCESVLIVIHVHYSLLNVHLTHKKRKAKILLALYKRSAQRYHPGQAVWRRDTVWKINSVQ